jgi:multidrug efflux pump subunit AcrA (membrane-fusion protein)
VTRVAFALRAACLCAALSAGCGGSGPTGPGRAAARVPNVGVVIAGTRDLAYQVEAIGTLEARQVVTVPSRGEGPVESLDFDEGRAVTTSTVLAVVDGSRRDLLLDQSAKAVTKAQASVERARADVARATAQGGAAQASLTEQRGMLARREAGRKREPGLVSEEEVEQVRAQVARWQAQVDEAAAAAESARAAEREADAALAEARAREAVAKRDADDARVHPPLPGVVQTRHVVVGQWVKAGAPIATLVDTSVLRLRFRVPEAESVALGSPRASISFRTAALPGRALRADLVYVQGTADPVTRMVECLAEVKDTDPSLKPGFFASVTVEVRRGKPSVVVPEESILATEQGLVAWTLVNDKATRAVVRPGLRTKDGWVEVLDGLAAGVPVAVENAYVLQPDMAVKTFPTKRTAGGSPAPRPDGSPPADGSAPGAPPAVAPGPPADAAGMGAGG